MIRMRRMLVTVLAVLSIAIVSGCEFTGINSRSLPLTKGGGDGDYQVTVMMENAVNLVPNSEVKVSEVTIGSVRKIEFDSKAYAAKLTLGIEKETKLPKNVRAKIGQKSLLGAEYLELSVPEDPDSALLADGDVIGLDQSSRFPETEEVLSSLSLLLNGGGLGQIQTITRELNLAIEGNEPEIRQMVSGLSTFLGTLDEQKTDIIAALDGLDRLAASYAGDTETIQLALDSLPAGIEALADEREELTKTLNSLGDFGDITNQIVDDTRADLVENLNNIEQTIGGIADGSDVLIDAIGSVTWPFPENAVLRGFKGDYINLFPTIDLSIGAIEQNFLGGTPLDGLYSGLLGQLPTGAIIDGIDPLKLALSPFDGSDKSSEFAAVPGIGCAFDGIPLLNTACAPVSDEASGGSDGPEPAQDAAEPAQGGGNPLLDLFKNLGGGS